MSECSLIGCPEPSVAHDDLGVMADTDNGWALVWLRLCKTHFDALRRSDDPRPP